MKKRRGFVCIFVLAAIMALSLFCVKALELASLDRRLCARKIATVKNIYLLEQGLAMAKAYVLSPASGTLDAKQSLHPEPGLDIVIEDESAKAGIFLLAEQDKNRAERNADFFFALTRNRTQTEKLKSMAQTRTALNASIRGKRPELFPETLEEAIKDGPAAGLVTALKTRGINVNAAPETVLAAAMGPAAARSLARAREKEKIAGRKELEEIVGKTALARSPALVFDSKLYSLHVTARREGAPPLAALLYIEVAGGKDAAPRIREIFCEEARPRAARRISSRPPRRADG